MACSFPSSIEVGNGNKVSFSADDKNKQNGQWTVTDSSSMAMRMRPPSTKIRRLAIWHTRGFSRWNRWAADTGSSDFRNWFVFLKLYYWGLHWDGEAARDLVKKFLYISFESDDKIFYVNLLKPFVKNTIYGMFMIIAVCIELDSSV